MKRIFSVRGFEILLSFLGASFFLWAWVSFVQPFPDRDSVQQFLFPVLNYLQAAAVVGNDFFYLDKLMFEGLPTGILLIPWLLCGLGLSEAVTKAPWILDVFLLIPLCFVFWLVPVPSSRRWFFILLLFFFPPLHLLLKNLNLHSFNVLYCLAGIFLVFEYRNSSNKLWLIPAILFFFFACVVKHLGLILFLSLWLSYLLWLKRRGESLQRPLWTGAFIVVSSSFFYPIESIFPYFQTLMSQNPLISPTWIYLICGSGLFLLLFGWFQGVSEHFGRVPLDDFFGRLWFFLLGCALVTWILTISSDFHPLTWMLGSFLVGNGVLIAFLRWRQFDTQKGFLILSFLMLVLTALVFYFSQLGQVSAFFVLPFVLLLVVYVQEAKRSLHLGLVLLFFLIFSNLFPPLHRLEPITGKFGFNLYSRGLNMLHQNPFGWERSKVQTRRKQILELLQALDFQDFSEGALVSRYGIHHHQAVEFLFPEQFQFEIPPLALVEQLPLEEQRPFYSDYLKNPTALYQMMAEEGRITLILAGPNLYDRYEQETLPERLPDAGGPGEGLMYTSPFVKLWFHDPFFQFLKDKDLLNTYYDRYSLGNTTEDMELYIHKKVKKKAGDLAENSRLAALEKDYLEYRNPNLKISRRYFLKSNALLDQGRFLEAFVYLQSAFDLTPENGEIRKDLEIVKGRLQSFEQEILNTHGIPKLLEVLKETNSLPWKTQKDWKSGSTEPVISDEEMERRRKEAGRLFSVSSQYFSTSPHIARSYLEKAVELDPSHESAREDLEILRAQEKKEVLNQKFQRKPAILKGSLEKRRDLLNEVLEIDPDNKDAARELAIIESILSTAPDVLAAKNEEADKLFHQSTKFFESNPRKAEEMLLQVLELNPIHAGAIEDLNAIRVRKQARGPLTSEERKAEDLFQQAIEIFHANPIKAQKMLQKVVQIDPGHQEAKRDLEVLKKAVDRKRAQDLYHESLLYYRQNPRKAVSMLEEVLRLDPGHQVAAAELKKIRSFLDADSLQKALARKLTSEARTLLETNSQKAQSLLQRALKLDPGNEEARAGLEKLAEPGNSVDSGP